MAIDRRTLLGLSGTLALGFVLSRRGCKRDKRPELVTDPEGILDLREGFEVTVLQRSGDAMSDGYRVPGMPDAMGLFVVDGQWVLMRNHELMPGQAELSAHVGRAAPGEAFDPKSAGGVSRLALDPGSLKVARSNLVLTGTNMNCAGGHSPLGWLSCEEDVSPGHGFVFACDPRADSVRSAQKLDDFGRFRHEAGVTDARSGITYLTEDRVDGCLYRCLPNDPTVPERGRLQALAIEGDEHDTSSLRTGAQRVVRWLDLERPSSESDNLRRQARERGAAVFRRGEGAFLSEDRGQRELLVAATAGGPAGLGQIFSLTIADDRLSLLYASEEASSLEMPDNITVAPSGHVLMAEDGSGRNGIQVLCPNGKLLTLAENPGRGELAGVCVSPDGSVVFANLQQRGLTVAIRGPLAALG